MMTAGLTASWRYRRVSLMLFFTLLTKAAAQALPAATDSTTTSSASRATTTSVTPTSSITTTQSTETTSNTSSTSFPSLSSSTTEAATTVPSTPPTTVVGLPNAPTISGYAVPPLIVPNTSAAPFMQRSNLPEGTVFICAGAALALFGLCVLAWRGWVAWSLQRSVQRAATSYYGSDTKSSCHPGPMGPGGVQNGTNMSLNNLTSTKAWSHGNSHEKRGKSQRRERSKGQQSRTPTSSTLFFSPTAGAVGSMQHSSNRASSFLPAGYYASGSGAPASGASTTHFGGSTTAGYGRIEPSGYTPPDTPRASRPSPGKMMSGGGELEPHANRGSEMSSIGSTNPGLTMPGQRAPSAVLDSWFEQTAYGK